MNINLTYNKFRIILMFFILLSFNLYSQDSIRKKKRFIGMLLSPDYSSAILSNGNPDPNSFDKYNDSKLQGKLSFTCGMDYLIQYNQHLSLSFGVQYSIKDGMTNQGSMYAQPENNIWIKHDLVYIDLPVKLNYYFLGKSITPYVSIGISPNYFIYWGDNKRFEPTQYRIDIAPAPTMNYNGHQFNPINPQAQVGIGLDINRKNKGRVRLETIFRYAILPANNLPNDWYGPNVFDCTRTLYSFGLAVSYLWGLKEK